MAVINGFIHGYEIKSAKDTLDRLAAQIEIYRQTLQKLTIVAAPRHIVGVLTHAPEWCGLIEVKLGPRSGIRFHPVRSAAHNPDIEPVMLAHLLWRNEVVDLLTKLGYSPKELRRPRTDLYEMLCRVANSLPNYSFNSSLHGETQSMARSSSTCVIWWLIHTSFQRV